LASSLQNPATANDLISFLKALPDAPWGALSAVADAA
jgi:hypothetical protein